jgi:hypothetical protein
MQEQDKVVSMRQEATGVVDWAHSLAVASKSDADEAMVKLAEIKGIRNRWVAYWAPLKKAANEAWKGIVAKEKEGTDAVDAAERLVKAKVLAWQQAERAKAEAEQRRLQAEADAKARAEQERLLKLAEQRKTPEKQEEYRQAAAAVVAPVVTVSAPVADAAGTSTRKTFKAVLVDKDALIKAATPGSVASTMLVFDQRVADAFARSTKGAVAVPGVRLDEVESLSVRSM